MNQSADSGRTVEVAEQPEEHRSGSDRSQRIGRSAGRNLVAQALMRTPMVVVGDVFLKQILKVLSAQNNEMIQTFTTGGTDKPLGVSVEVRVGDAGRMVGDAPLDDVARFEFFDEEDEPTFAEVAA